MPTGNESHFPPFGSHPTVDVATMPPHSDRLILKCQERDLTILIGKEEKPYYYYSVFLAARMEMIDVMLSHDMKEKNEMTIRFSDISVSDWETTECYIYPNEYLEYSAFVGDNNVEQVLRLAERFQMKQLLATCDSVMWSKACRDGGSSLCRFATDLCVHGSSLPMYTANFMGVFREGRYTADDVTKKTIEKLLEWSDLNDGALCKLFKEHGYIPPILQGMDLSKMFLDYEKIATMMLFKIAPKSQSSTSAPAPHWEFGSSAAPAPPPPRGQGLFGGPNLFGHAAAPVGAPKKPPAPAWVVF